MAKGILTPPPKGDRQPRALSPDQIKRRDPNYVAPQKLQGLNKDQNKMVQQRMQGDVSLGNVANNQMGQIQQSFANPFDWSQVTQGPVQGDFNTWRDQQIGLVNQQFDKRNNPIFAQQNDDFEQQMANRGIPVGSELYNKQKTLLQQQQQDARESAQVAAMGMAGQNAQQFFDIGSQAHGQSLQDQMLKRSMPLNEYNQLMAARSGMDEQNAAFSQQMKLQSHAAKLAKQGRGGGGGGAEWQQYGFATPQEYDAYQDARRINMYNATNPRQSQPSYGAQLGGGLLGSVLGGWAQSGFKGLF